MIIDFSQHWYPREYATLLSHRTLLYFFDAIPHEGFSHVDDPKERIKKMDNHGIDIAVISLWHPIWEGIRKNDVNDAAKMVNDKLADVSNTDPSHFISLASPPMIEESSTLEEIDRAIGLGHRGFIMGTNVLGKPLDSPEFLPIFERIAKYDVPVLLHPIGDVTYFKWVDDYRLNRSIGCPFETSIAVLRLIYSGVLDRFPTLKLVAHQGGGLIPYFSDRISRGHEKNVAYHSLLPGSDTMQTIPEVSKSVRDYLQMIYVDTCVSGAAHAVRCMHEFSGPDKVVFGTDLPFGNEAGDALTKWTFESVHALNLAGEDKAKIFEGNARRLLRIK
ncbi:MAG: amidohydrolase family protein [Nitrososphaerales archaeon]